MGNLEGYSQAGLHSLVCCGYWLPFKIVPQISFLRSEVETVHLKKSTKNFWVASQSPHLKWEAFVVIKLFNFEDFFATVRFP